ncbi:MAG: DUF5652 family protein [Candidatus Pacebacteria bacterium]|nr:DUF5652 family protein [Candidatus Paceibacterota bacterium]MDD3047959.1 DUF5652 family protein [Candidatus Paceibacterota bacterium]MDD3918467.1 DUF5652 family protein [Candidatus Paceibacterota bacterium]MDD4664471.1 DUF5652 family protein [Candidatus Paceibacterota bacterium]
MMVINGFLIPVKILVLIQILAIFDLIVRGIALWHSAQRKEKKWFVCLFIFNTVGILPLIYLYIISNNVNKS